MPSYERLALKSELLARRSELEACGVLNVVVMVVCFCYCQATIMESLLVIEFRVNKTLICRNCN